MSLLTTRQDLLSLSMVRTRFYKSCWGIKSHSSSNASYNYVIIVGDRSRDAKRLTRSLQMCYLGFSFGNVAGQSMHCIFPISRRSLQPLHNKREHCRPWKWKMLWRSLFYFYFLSNDLEIRVYFYEKLGSQNLKLLKYNTNDIHNIDT